MRLILIIPCLFFVHVLTAQNQSFDAFRALFNEIEFEELHAFTFTRYPGHFTETSLYPFKGTEIETSFYHLMEDKMESIDSEMKYSILFATHRFYLTDKLEVFLVREYHDGGGEHHIHYLIVDSEKKTIIKDMDIAYGYGYEGAMGNTESWIMDVNKDGIKDIITRTWTEYFLTEEPHYILKDTFEINIWKNDDYQSVGVSDSTLTAYMMEAFEFHFKNRFDYQTENDLSQFLEQEIQVSITDDADEKWSIVAGSDKDLESAKFEIYRAEKIIGYDYKYLLDTRQFQTIKKGERYYTVISGFPTKNDAAIALLEIQRVFNPTAWLIDMDNWCDTLDYQRGMWYQCEDE